MEILFKKLTDTAQEPLKGSSKAAGYDLYACIDGDNYITINPGTMAKIPTGLAIAIPSGFFGGIYARSGMATKRGLRPVQGVGVIDARGSDMFVA